MGGRAPAPAAALGLGSPNKAPYFVRTIVQQAPGAERPMIHRTDSLHSLTHLAVDAESIAAMRGVGIWTGDARDDTERNGLIALRRGDLSTRAYLPITDPSYSYSDGGAMAPMAWLDSDTVLISVTEVGGGHVADPDRTLFTWDVESGELQRLTSLPAWLGVDVAVGVL